MLTPDDAGLGSIYGRGHGLDDSDTENRTMLALINIFVSSFESHICVCIMVVTFLIVICWQPPARSLVSDIKLSVCFLFHLFRNPDSHI